MPDAHQNDEVVLPDMHCDDEKEAPGRYLRNGSSIFRERATRSGEGIPAFCGGRDSGRYWAALSPVWTAQVDSYGREKDHPQAC